MTNPRTEAVAKATMTDNSLTEHVARIHYERYMEPVRDLELSWDDLPQEHRDRMIDAQQAAISAVLERLVGHVDNLRIDEDDEFDRGYNEAVHDAVYQLRSLAAAGGGDD
jgi:hypothetical protein